MYTVVCKHFSRKAILSRCVELFLPVNVCRFNAEKKDYERSPFARIVKNYNSSSGKRYSKS